MPSRLAGRLAGFLTPEKFYPFGFYLTNQKNYAGHIDKIIHNYLDLVRLPSFMSKISYDTKWERLILDLIIKSNFTLYNLLNLRVALYGNKILFRKIQGKSEIKYRWADTANLVAEYFNALNLLMISENSENAKVAFLLENSFEMVILDLACLTSGVTNIMIPANSVSQHISFILNQTMAPILLVHDDKQLAKVKEVKNELKYLKKVVLVNGNSSEDWVVSFSEFLAVSGEDIITNWEKTGAGVNINDTATIMYTSGTTGEPKGILFSQLNIIYKRFCRGMALPRIGEDDRFLAYLPLFHTFGRYLEMIGSIYWAAEYCFMENPAVETMLSNMQLVQPTIFISIPKKWIQLYEYITSQVDLEIDPEEKIRSAVEAATGGKLRWGLSAAGFLPPEVFQFFQKFGVELMSGFGMTEATGGITMTPPGQYIPNSLGKALPGIEIKISDDGELLIKGSYVMTGYFAQDDSKTFIEDGWLPTGDIMRTDENGFIEIIDRKKEIYKNIKGETIAPQRIENFFRDFESVQQVFLVGDHRPFNTVLIYPNPDDKTISGMEEQQIQDYFSTVIVTVNKFLAPFERILDFRLIGRPFSAEKGELTPKGTYKRRVIEQEYNDIISSMYQKLYTSVVMDGTEIRIPNWFLREKGCLSRDITAMPAGLSIPKLQIQLQLQKSNSEDNIFKIGDFYYRVNSRYIDLQNLLTLPELWIGNSKLLEFSGDGIYRWFRQSENDKNLDFYDTAFSVQADQSLIGRFNKILSKKEISLAGVHLAVILLQSNYDQHNYLAIEYLKSCVEDDLQLLYHIVLAILKRPGITPSISVRREMFKIGIEHFHGMDFKNFVMIYIRRNFDLLDEAVIQKIIDSSIGSEHVEVIREITLDQITADTKKNNFTKSAVPAFLDLICHYGIRHPTSYKELRQFLVHLQTNSNTGFFVDLVASARKTLRNGFRTWLGDNETVAVDVETGKEYHWRDVITFDGDINKKDINRIIGAITDTPLLREAIFLFSDGVVIRLSHILPSGIWVSHLGTYHDKSVYRVSVQTRYQGAYDFAINVNLALSKEKVKEEINWLILGGSKVTGQRLFEDFGGYWKDYDLWTEEFVPGDTVYKYFERALKKKDETTEERLYNIWPFFIWNAAASYMNFWKLTNYKLMFADPSTRNIIIPSHDYQTGTRLVSVSNIVESQSVLAFFESFIKHFVNPTSETIPFLKKKKLWNYIFSGIINAVGEEKGIQILKDLLDEINQTGEIENRDKIIFELNKFIYGIAEDGYIAKRLFFAMKRFHRWYELNRDAAVTAQAEMLYELYETYRLAEVEKSYPETRTRFFLETAFSNSSAQVKASLKDLMKSQQERKVTKDEMSKIISNIKSEFKLSDEEEYFLTRLSFPHLKPTDTAELIKVTESGQQAANLVVRCEDYDGNPFQIRGPISPKEISRIHQLFIEANLLVTFNPEHNFLVAISDRGFIIGGLFYKYSNEETIHMEKIVVSQRFRRKGISDILMNELFNRMRSEKIKFITTGFFRPEYFYRFGFKIERKYSGLVKVLEEDNK